MARPSRFPTDQSDVDERCVCVDARTVILEFRKSFLGRELIINLEESADVCFGAHSGLKSDIAPCPKSARRRRRRLDLLDIGEAAN
jgi:hypothetical protein